MPTRWNGRSANELSRGAAAQVLPERGERERPDRGPDDEIVSFDEGDRSTRQREDRPEAVEGLEQDLVQVELARGRGRDVEDQIRRPGGPQGVGDGRVALPVAHR